MQGLLKRTGRVLLWVLGGLAVLAVLAVVAGIVIVRGLTQPEHEAFGTVQDEAKLAGLSVEDFPGAADPYFAEMDKGLLRAPAAGETYPEEIREIADRVGLDPEDVREAALRGQNMWMVWTGGNDRFWDFAAKTAIGSFDLLKIMSSHPSQAHGRDNRFRYLGLINEPCFEEAAGPSARHFGLWIDQRREDCPADPFADAARYPGVKIPPENLPQGRVEARGEPTPIGAKFPESAPDGILPVGSRYGEPTGLIGLRLFPNPDFDAEAAEAWNPERFYTDPAYYNRSDLVRPYRVGMSCAFCHVGPNPINPPKDVENPEWAELTSNPGAQYFWVDRNFFWNTKPRTEPGVPSPNEGNFLYQLFHTNPPGSLDTSLVSSDYMNNPRTMNAVYEVLARLEQAGALGQETLEGDERFNKQFQDFGHTAALAELYDEGSGRVASMRVLKDGADSVGALGALNRVYFNIGLFSEEWLLHFRPFLGGRQITPIRIEDAQKNSVFWQATERQSPDMAIFFLVTARADRLRDAPGGAAILDAQDPERVERGKVVFAETCAACHSSKQPVPDPAFGVDQGICEGGGAGPEYRICWDRYWAWTQSDSFKSRMVELVTAKDESGREPFLDGNYLSTERRVPLDVLGTNACSAIATNGLDGDIWDNFTSSTYKSLPPSGEIVVHHPESGGARSFQPLGGGRGYIRPASLVSLWSTAPYLLNNSIGHAPDHERPGYYASDEQPDLLTRPAEGSPTQVEAIYRPDESAGSTVRTVGADEYAPARTNEHRVEPEIHRPAYGSASCPSPDPGSPYMPCVENRLTAFHASIREMLSPELRRTDTETAEPVPGYIYRTTAPSCLVVPPGFAPDAVRRWSGVLSRLAPWAVTAEGGIELGPFPEGFPINALVNTKLLPDNDEADMWAHARRLLGAAPTLYTAFRDLGGQCSATELADPGVRQRAERVVRDSGLVDALVGLSKCPDYVVNRGHEFGAELSPSDKEALIAYLLHF